MRLCPECRQPSVDKPTMPGGLDGWHADCWELARVRREPALAAARRRIESVRDLSAYLLAQRRRPKLPRLLVDGLVGVGAPILESPEAYLVAHDNHR